jgi:hypothetical protein
MPALADDIRPERATYDLLGECMTRSLAVILSLALCGVAGGALAQEFDAETLAKPKDGETVKLDLQSIQRLGDVIGRFEVLITWTDTTRAVPADYLMRRVRYATNCVDGTYTLAAVGLMDRNGNAVKTLVVPPGAVDAVKPEKGTEAAKWVRQVCMF